MKLEARFARHAGGRRSRRGIALLYAVFAAFVAAGLVSVLMTVSRVSDKTAGTKRYGAQAEYLAEGGVEVAKKQIQTAVANWDAVPADAAVTIDGRSVPYTIAPTGFTTTLTDPSGVQTLVTGYEVRADAEVQGHRATVHRMINSEATPIFQFAVFYTDDLEINPGADMTVAGRVHSNRDMYLGSGATLTLNSNYVHAVGSIYRHRKDDPSQSTGTVKIRQWVANPFGGSEPLQYTTLYSKSQLAALGVPSSSGYDADFLLGFDSDGNGSYSDPGDFLPWGPGALDYWSEPDGYSGGSGHTVMDGSHSVGELVTPSVGSVAMFEPDEGGDYAWNAGAGAYVAVPSGTGTHSKGFYHDQADLSIIVKPGSPLTWKAYDGAGIDVSAAVSAAISVGGLYDARQANGAAGQTKTVVIDVAKLATTGKFPPNGLLYAAHYGEGTGTNAKGVVLKNGATLPGKLTVASEDPIYVQGDYNKNSPKGAAVIGDAINLLSNSWNGSKTATSGLPTASNTTYNVAMLAGNQTSTVGGYNGGLENLPRFHENWTGKTCSIKGSFVNPWNSQHATGGWVYGGNRYTAPNRDYRYDTAFNNVANLPPFTPMVVSARDVVSW